MKLGRHVEHDERSRNFPAPVRAVKRSVLWGHHAPVLDQGQVGSCTGNAMAQLLNSDPFYAARRAAAGKSAQYLTETEAVKIYSLATHLDGIPGSYPPDDTGSSGLAVSKAARHLGYLDSYHHSFGFDHFCSTLQSQPVIVGTDWFESMYTPDSNGLVKVGGSVEGGHEYVALGIDYNRQRLAFLNSWSREWGDGGRFYMSFNDFRKLLARAGDVVAPAWKAPK